MGLLDVFGDFVQNKVNERDNRINKIRASYECSGQVQPDTFGRDSSKSMGDKTPLAECNRIWL